MIAVAQCMIKDLGVQCGCLGSMVQALSTLILMHFFTSRAA